MSRILVVDDEAISREPLAEILIQEGYTVDTAGDAASGAEMLERNTYDLVISDLNMPGNANLEFLRHVTSRFPAVALLVITGRPTLQSSIDALRMNAVDYVLKPLEYPSFLKLVKNALARAGVLAATRQIREECSRMAQDVVAFESAVSVGKQPSETQQSVMPEQLLDMTLSHIFRSALNFRTAHRLYQSRPSGSGVDGEFCRVIGCPARTAYRQGIEDAIRTIEATRGSFKSKELGDLRQRLETLLRTFEN